MDTFLGNADRSRPNLFYDREHDCFLGIDLAASFRSPLAKTAIRQITEMQKQGFSQSELAALQVYQQTLSSLNALVSIDDLYSWCQEMAALAHLEDSGRLTAIQKRWHNNYTQTLVLSSMLKELSATEQARLEDHQF